MSNRYVNQSDVDRAIQLARSVSLDVRELSYSLRWNTDICIRVTVSIPLKGHKKEIDQLVALGFKPGRRRATLPRVDWLHRTTEYSFLLDLSMDLPEYKVGEPDECV